MKKLLLVMNPYAGLKKANKVLPEILTVFNQAGYENLVYMTQRQGNGTEIVLERGKDVDLVVCVGGDGTFNEVLAGVMNAGLECPVGYIPAGSTNDFANSLGLPTDPVKAAKVIVEGTPQAYDVGSFGGRYFSYVASFGVFTKASYTTAQSVKNVLGHLAYVLEGIKELSQIKSSHLKFELEEEVFEGDYIFGAISNSTSVGGVLTLSKDLVDLADGKFELLLVRAPKNAGELSDCVVRLLQQKYDSPMLTLRAASKVHITAPQDMTWTLDGEMEPGHDQVLVENHHLAFSLMK